MGCMSSKSVIREGSVDTSRISQTKRNEVVVSKSNSDSKAVKAMLDKRVNGDDDDQIERKAAKIVDQFVARKNVEKNGFTVVNHQGSESIPKTVEVELKTAGWPSWLVSVAGEALKGWAPRRASSFKLLEKIGQGTYSTVHRACDITNNKIVALKKVRFDKHDLDSIRFMAREILILRRLDHPNIIKLEGLITSPESSSVYLVFEYMEHDLVGLLSLPGIKFTEPQIKCYMQQLLSGLDHCHSRGVLHRDIKGSNLLVDSNGILKIADFGLASFFDPHHNTPLTSRVVTLWYRPPELLLGASHYGVAVDLWSTGCILGELYAGQPILPGKTEVEQIHKIFKLCGSPSNDYWMKLKLRNSTAFKPVLPYRRCLAETYKYFPAPALNLLERLLSMDPADRGTAALALESDLFTKNPLACDPSSLPKYPPCKEIDAKLREEARRARAEGCGDQKVGRENRGQREPQVIHAPIGNISSAAFLQNERHSNTRSRSQMLNSLKVEPNSGSLIDPPNRFQAVKVNQDLPEHQRKKASYSGPLAQGVEWQNSRKRHDDPLMASTKSSFSGLLSTRTMYEGSREKSGLLQPEGLNKTVRYRGSFKETQLVVKQDRKSQKIVDSVHTRTGRTILKQPTMHRSGSKGNKIYVSGPLLGPTNNMDKMLKEHDQKIQDHTRRARSDKTKPGRGHAQGKKQPINNSTLLSMRVGR
ncbi:hypothetical protein ACFE04_018026 [Oxalis oulophora]